MAFEGERALSAEFRWERTGNRKASNAGYLYVEEMHSKTGKVRWKRLRGKRVYYTRKLCPYCKRWTGMKTQLCQSCGFNFNIREL